MVCGQRLATRELLIPPRRGDIVKLDPVLLDILVCPDCKGELRVDDEHDELICTQCGLIYPVRDNIPVMLVDEARRETPERRGDESNDSSSDTSADAPAADELPTAEGAPPTHPDA
jgi:uncharacterized protein YbaR (Trm112 family)